MEFHKAQLEAIRHFNGPCITLAGPGSGKTTVLTYRILNLIEKCGVAPEHIDFHYLDLLAHRSLSNKIADDLNVYHESPQVLLLQNGECVFDESHQVIRMQDIIAEVV